MRLFLKMTLALGLLGLFLLRPTNSFADQPPNIVFMLCDDLGYGDVACLNDQCKIRTPCMDQLAKQGMIFTDAHSGSAVCTPTRYGVLTGRYAWRSKLQNGVLGGLSPRLIEPDRETVASFLKAHGYATACIGKWHLGMDWVKLAGKQVNELGIESAVQNGSVDFSKPYTNGPNAVGFDYYFGIAASLDMVPYTFLENDRCTALPTEDASFEMMLGNPKGKTRKGPRAAEFDAMDVLPKLTEKAVEYIHQRKAANAEKPTPFFLYLPFASPHTPILPTKEWQGKSGLNPYADFVMQNDACIGQVLKALDDAELADNTLVILTSDNGCSPQANFPALLAKGHNPSYVFRGHKADIFDGGHRVPFIVRWPGHAAPGSQTDQLTCLTDLFATAAEIVEAPLPDNAAEDSYSFVSVLEGKASDQRRPAVVHHSINGSFSIRKGDWKLCLCPGSGGWSDPRPGKEPKGAALVQLFNLSSDIGERANIEQENAPVVEEMVTLLTQYVDQGRSTPGKKQENTVPVRIWKSGKPGNP